MGSGGQHTAADILLADCQFGGGQSIHFFQGQPQFVAAKYDAYRPDFGIHSLFDVGNRIAYFHYTVCRRHGKLRHVLINHIRSGTPGRQSVGSDTIVNHISAGCGGRQYDIHHCTVITGSRAYLNPLRTQSRYCFDHTGNGCRIVFQGCKQHTLKIRIARQYIFLGIRAAVFLFKLVSYAVDMEQSAYFLYFGQPHVGTCLSSRYRSAYHIKTLNESGDRSETAVIDCRACPIHDNTFNFLHNLYLTVIFPVCLFCHIRKKFQ